MKSIIDNGDRCHECGAPATEIHHCLHGIGRRRLADKDGLTVPLCRRCHEILHSSKGHDMDRRYQKLGEIFFLQSGHTVEDFIARYGKNYL